MRFPVADEPSLLDASKRVWELSRDMGFSSLESMHIRTAVSELGRNILKYAGKGEILVNPTSQPGLKLIFSDEGPGIEDIDKAQEYGFSTGNSLGLGLPGAKKLADKFEMYSTPGKGTQVVFVKYARGGPRQTDAIFAGWVKRSKNMNADTRGDGKKEAGRPSGPSLFSRRMR